MKSDAPASAKSVTKGEFPAMLHPLIEIHSDPDLLPAAFKRTFQFRITLKDHCHLGTLCPLAGTIARRISALTGQARAARPEGQATRQPQKNLLD
ncbi:MAG: hypothetical protein QM682_13710 [Paracoccus sp. (in: a-proteobacteria)]|uniref:hypothetical protein n=1 Tax=Paracoccus sp. TaxID=267 RepID=UPI0039E403DA